MQIITLGIGIVIGLLLREIKLKAVEVTEEFVREARELRDSKQGVQFFEPVSVKERFDKAKVIDDFVQKL